MNPPHEKWFVIFIRTSYSPIIYNTSMIFILSWARLTIIDKELTLKHLGDFFDGYQFTPQQITKISPSKFMYSNMIILLLLLLLILIIPFVLNHTIPIVAVVLLILAILIYVIPVILFKCYRINHRVEDYPSYIYIYCLRRHSSSIMDALTRCGFGDKT